MSDDLTIMMMVRMHGLNGCCVSAQLAAVSLVGAITFYFFGNAHDVTEEIDREIAERRGNKASDVDRGIAFICRRAFPFVRVFRLPRMLWQRWTTCGRTPGTAPQTARAQLRQTRRCSRSCRSGERSGAPISSSGRTPGIWCLAGLSCAGSQSGRRHQAF